MNANVAQESAPGASRLYYNLASFYEYFAAPVYTGRIHSTLRSLSLAKGAKVLEIGVGTGISLPAYPETLHVTAIDLSRDMLDQAAAKIEAQGWEHIELRQMDALNLEFRDEHFDCVVAFHVASVVPNIQQMMREMMRVCKPGGTLVVINHFRSPRIWVAAAMDKLNPVTRVLGWRIDLPVDEVVNTAHLRVTRQFKTSPTSLFTVVVGQKTT